MGRGDARGVFGNCGIRENRKRDQDESPGSVLGVEGAVEYEHAARRKQERFLPPVDCMKTVHASRASARTVEVSGINLTVRPELRRRAPRRLSHSLPFEMRVLV